MASALPIVLPRPQVSAGAPVLLPSGPPIWRITGVAPHRAEIYLQTSRRRTLIAVVGEDALVFPPDPPMDAGLVVVAPTEATLVPLSEGLSSTFGELSFRIGQAELCANAEAWVVAALAMLAEGLPAPDETLVQAAPGERIRLHPGAAVKSAGPLVWLDQVSPDQLALGGCSIRGPTFPLHGHVTPIALAEATHTATSTSRLAEEGRLVPALNAFTSEFAALMHACADARDRAIVDRINARESRQSFGDASTMQAVNAICQALRIERSQPPSAGNRSPLDHLRQAGLRGRRIELPPRWWLEDHGPLLVHDDRSGRTFALVRIRGAYAIATGQGRARRLTSAEAAQFRTNAYAVHPALPEKVTDFTSLARHILPGIVRDGAWAVAAGAGLGLAGVLVPVMAGWVLRDIVPGQLTGLLIAAGLALVASALFAALFATARNLVLQRIDGRTGLELFGAIADRVLRLPPKFFVRRAAGDLDHRLTAVDTMRQLITEVLIGATITLAFSFVYLALLVVYDPMLALLSVALVSAYALAVALARMLQIKHLRRAAELAGAEAGTAYETLAGIAKLRAAAAEERALARWLEVYGKERREYLHIGRVAAHFDAFADSYQIVTRLALFAAVAVVVSDGLPAGIFIAFLIAFGAFQGAVVGFSQSLVALFAAAPMAERARPILSTPVENSEGRTDAGRLTGAIEISALTFSYPGSTDRLLHHVDLSIAPGEHIAIVGPSGSGKSTLLRLLLGLETPAGGAILYDGRNLERLDLTSVRRQIGVVLQTNQLFAGTLFENIRAASEATLFDCMRYAEQAGLTADLARFPLGLQTPLVDGAATLSAGQKQRILIARALAARPAILFLDEATSALDNEMQALVTRTLASLSVTRITIAHRLSTIRNAARICVLQEGTIVEVGCFDDLLARGGAFTALAKRQLISQ